MDTLRITDYVTSVELAASPHTLLAYMPEVGPAGMPAGGPGSQPLAETLSLALGGDTLAQALAERQRLVRLLAQAGRAAAGSGEAPVYVECRRGPGQALVRSPLLGGCLAEQDCDGYWPARSQLRCALAWQRRPWWEGVEQELPALDILGQPVLDGSWWLAAWGPRGAGCYADLGDVGGELPTPLRLRISNASPAYALARLYVGLHSVPAAAWDFAPVVEGEAAVLGGVTQPAGGAMEVRCSGGKYRWLSWLGNGESLLARWEISAQQVGLAGRRWFRLLARWFGAPTYADLQVQARLTTPGGEPLWIGPWVRTSPAHELCDLGQLPLPPRPGPAGLAACPLRLELHGEGSGEASHALNLDYLALLPLDGVRIYLAPTGGIQQDEALIDDGPAGLVYASLAAGHSGFWLTAGGPLLLTPGYQHRLLLLWENSAGLADANHGGWLQFWYRPRLAQP